MFNPKLPPDASERDAYNRELAGTNDDIWRGEDIEFVTRRVDSADKAAVIAVLLAQREAETNRVRLVERQYREPWARSQRTPEGIGELLSGS
ncbi:MAG TPA: hypothetical protein VLZ31_01600 [Microbacteriaceae bacterium]|nr:hypothetical protein [Microbacteriaceae bacterium]